MKKMILIPLVLLSQAAMAENLLGDSTIICKKGVMELGIDSRTGFLSTSMVQVRKEGSTVLKEEMKRKEYKYNERQGLYTPEMREAQKHFTKELAQNGVRTYGDDVTLFESDNTLVYVNESQLNPKMGGAPTTVNLSLESGPIVQFNFKNDCRVVRGMTNIMW